MGGSQAFLLWEITSGPWHLLFSHLEFPFPIGLHGSVLHSGFYSNVTSSESSLGTLIRIAWTCLLSFLSFVFLALSPQLTDYPFIDLSL